LKILVVGQGYVGLPLAIASAKAGHQVTGCDLSNDLVEKLNAGNSHIEDVSSNTLLELLSLGRYRAISNPEEINEVDVAVIAVPTPLTPEREPDLTFVESASAILGKYLLSETLIINESTSFPGTLRNVIAPLVERSSPKGLEHKFAVSPERVDPGSVEWDIASTPRIYSGLTDLAMAKTQEFYASFCSKLIEVETPEIAEAAKLFENTFRQVNIALVNEFALITPSLNIPVHKVLDAAATKPYGFMKFSPGIGVGGHCIPVDPTYLAHVAKQANIEPRFIELANRVNLDMPESIVARIEFENGGSLKGKKVLVCGVAYKSNVSDIRETPSELLLSALNQRGAITKWHDPLVGRFNGATSEVIGVEKFDIVIVAVLHDQMDIEAIFKVGDYLFDCTGKIVGAKTL